MNAESLAVTMDSEPVIWLLDKARTLGAHLTGSMIVEEQNRFYNRLLWATPAGDLYHYDKKLSQQAMNAQSAAQELDIPLGIISIAPTEDTGVALSTGQLPFGESKVMFRGRAVNKLAHHADTRPWYSFDLCPEEDLLDPGRIHLDPMGNLHICQGISLGNLFDKPLKEICESYDPKEHPITGPLIEGGPAELARRYSVSHAPDYADACHLCYETRTSLRQRFPELLLPDQMYGVF
jgi:hypothetical protein